MSETKVIIALLAGLVAGAALGILFAPEAGTETRDKLSESLAGLGESIKDAASEQIDKLVGVFKDKATGIEAELGREKSAPPTDDLEHA